MGTWTATPRTWVAGEVPTAANFNTDVRDFGRAFADAWTSYTPTLTASTTNPTNWTQTGYYMRAGKLVICKFILTAGASFTAGSGNYRVALPVNASTTGSIEVNPSSSMIADVSTGYLAVPTIIINNTSYLEWRYPATYPTGASTAVSNSTPFAWGSGDIIRGALVYEAA